MIVPRFGEGGPPVVTPGQIPEIINADLDFARSESALERKRLGQALKKDPEALKWAKENGLLPDD